MKKTLILFITALSCSLAFMSCGFNNLQVPKKVKVRTDATYEFSVLNFDSTKEDSKFKVSDYFDLGKTLEEKTSSSESDTGLEIFKYNDGSQYQQFLIHMPLKEIEFDFSESFKDMDFSTSAQNFNIDKEIVIPAIDGLSKSDHLDLSNIVKVLNEGVKLMGAASPADLGLTFPIIPSVYEFSTLSYTSGKLIVDANYDGTKNPNGGDIEGKIALYKGEKKLTEGTFENNIAELDLAGVTIEQSGLTVKYTGFSDYYGISFIISVDSESKINTATGITLAADQFEVQDTEISFPITLDSQIKQAIIKEGTLNVSIETQPEGWSENVIGNYTITISEAIDPSVTINKGDDTTGNLNNKEIKGGNLKATAHVPVTLSDATIVFPNSPAVSVQTQIQKITAEIVMPDTFQTTFGDPAGIDPGEIKDFVSWIQWKDKGAGFVIKAKNNLPANNDMTLTMSATEIGLSSVTKTIESGTDGTEQVIEFLCGNNVKTEFDENTKFHVTGSLGVTEGPASADNAKTILITDVQPGKTYNISLVVEPKFDWAEANVKLPADKTHFASEFNTGMNKKEIFSVLGDGIADKIGIRSIPLYLFANIPESLGEDFKFEGHIKAFYGTEENGTITPVSGGSETDILPANSEIGASNALPAFEKNEADEVTNNFGNATLDFANALNLSSETGTLCLNYDIGLKGSGNDAGVTITSESIDALKAQGKSAIKIDIVLLFSMDFQVNGQINIDLMEIAKKKDSDLLGRSEPTDISAYEQYLSVVKSAAMTIDNFKLPISGEVALKLDMYGDNSGETKEIGNGKSFTLEVNPNKLLKQYPLKPDIQFVIGKANETTNFGLLRTMPVGGNIKLKVKANGDIQVYPFSEQN